MAAVPTRSVEEEKTLFVQPVQGTEIIPKMDIGGLPLTSVQFSS